MTRKDKLPRVGQMVVTRWFTPGYPTGLSAEAMVKVVEVRKRDRRICVDRDGRGTWWLDASAVRALGEA